MAIGDANVGFTLTPESRSRLIRSLDALAQVIPQSAAFLIDMAGRIVDVPRKPPGVNIEAVSALAAGCHASTNELAGSMSEKGFALLFEHGDDRQVYVWPVADRALLIVLLRGAAAVEQFEAQMEGKLGQEIEAVVKEGREPLQAVPPPRIEPAKVPPDLDEKVRQLNALVMELQGKKPTAFLGESGRRLLKSREDLVQTMSREDWAVAAQLCEDAKKWLSTL